MKLIPCVIIFLIFIGGCASTPVQENSNASLNSSELEKSCNAVERAAFAGVGFYTGMAE